MNRPVWIVERVLGVLCKERRNLDEFTWMDDGRREQNVVHARERRWGTSLGSTYVDYRKRKRKDTFDMTFFVVC